MTDDAEQMTKMEVQHAEIDGAKKTLRRQRTFLNKFVGMRGAEAGGPKRAYLHGVHDGLLWGERQVGSITQYEDYQQIYDVRYVPDDEVSNLLETLVTEANNENHGNVRVNAERLVEHLEEHEDDGDGETDE